MAKEVLNDRVVKVECYYDSEAAAWKARAHSIVCESSDKSLAKRKNMEMDLSQGTFQADLDALVAEALVQTESDEGI